MLSRVLTAGCKVPVYLMKKLAAKGDLGSPIHRAQTKSFVDRKMEHRMEPLPLVVSWVS